MPTNQVISQANKWLKTPYEYGGGDKGGIDCSHFVWEVLKSAGYPNAPYTEAKRMSSSPFYSRISPEEVREGDIVHFSGGDPHMGIVVDPRRGIFIGSQTSTGVAEVNYLTSVYWSGKTRTFYRYMER